MKPQQEGVAVGLNAVIAAVTDNRPRILTVRPSSEDLAALDHPDRQTVEHALPFGPLDPAGDRTLELGLRRWVREQTGIELGYVEQLYTYGDRDREPGDRWGGRRLLSVGYLALVKEGSVAGTAGASWHDWYAFLPWEDCRSGRSGLPDRAVQPALDAWIEEAEDPVGRATRREREEITFGVGGASWDGERVLERYELLYEASLVLESWLDGRSSQRQETDAPGGAGESSSFVPGLAMALDHRRILATALGRLRGKLRYRPVVFELLPSRFTLLQLQQTVEALAGMHLHQQNFRRLVERAGLVDGTGELEHHTGGRPAELFRFRRDVLRERPAPGVGLPGLKA